MHGRALKSQPARAPANAGVKGGLRSRPTPGNKDAITLPVENSSIRGGPLSRAETRGVHATNKPTRGVPPTCNRYAGAVNSSTFLSATEPFIRQIGTFTQKADNSEELIGGLAF